MFNRQVFIFIFLSDPNLRSIVYYLSMGSSPVCVTEQIIIIIINSRILKVTLLTIGKKIYLGFFTALLRTYFRYHHKKMSSIEAWFETLKLFSFLKLRIHSPKELHEKNQPSIINIKK